MMHIVFSAFLLTCSVQDPPSDERIDQLIDQLAADYEEERENARRELEKLGAAAERPLIGGLKKDDYRIRRGCLQLLAAMKSTKAVDPASALYRNADEDKSVRQEAFDYLRTTGKLAEDVLIEALDSSEPLWRFAALQTLTEFKSEKCAEKAAALYDKEQDKKIKDAAFACLKNVGKPAQPFLLKLMGSQDPAVRRGAIEGLKNIGATSDELFEPVSKLFLVETAAETLSEAYEFLKLVGAKAVPTFLAGLKSAQEIVRLKSIEGLEQVLPDEALEPLAQIFEADAVETVRRRASDTLGKYGLKAEDALIKALANAVAKTRLRAIELLGEIKSEKPYDKIAQLYREDKDMTVHATAFAYLERVGIRAEKELILALKDESSELRLRAIRALGIARSEVAIEPLLELVTDLNADVRNQAMDALVRLGTPAMKAVEAAVQAGRVKRKTAEAITALYHQEQVEVLLQKLITSQGGTGFFEGQFDALAAYGREHAVPVLVKMAIERAYPWRTTEWKGERYKNLDSLRELAIMALGYLGDDAAAQALEATIKDSSDEDEYEEYVVALYRLGKKGIYGEFTNKLRTECEAGLKEEDKTFAYSKAFSLAMMQNRVGEREAALASYLRLVKRIEEFGHVKTSDLYPLALYNVACLYSLQGDKKKAVEYLAQAVDGGFKDRDWILMDKELDAVRGEAAYQTLIDDAKRFEKGPRD